MSLTDWTTGDLAVRDLAAASTRRVTNKGPWTASDEHAEFSIFSPDVFDATIHPSGSRIALSAGELRKEVWMREHFLPAETTVTRR